MPLNKFHLSQPSLGSTYSISHMLFLGKAARLPRNRRTHKGMLFYMPIYL